MSELYWIFLFCVVLITKIGTDIYASWAKKWGIVDKADGLRKLQKNPIPVGGGCVIFIVMTLSLFAGMLYLGRDNPLSAIPKNIILIIGTSLLLTMAGFWDDNNGMKGKNKLLVQILASTIIVAFARNYSSVELWGHSINLGHLFYPLAIFWLVGFINAVNLIDGADGVASTFGVFFFVSAGIIGLIQGAGYEPASLFSFVMAAAILGFFLCNRPPAKIYLGDTGSMLIGFLAGILLLNVCSVNRNTIRFFPAFAIAFLPICDSFLAIVRRKLTGRSIYFADRSHLHHRIQTRIGHDYILLAVLSALQIPLCLGGIAGIYYHNDWIPLGAVGGVLFILIVTGLFGRDELVIIVRGVRKLLGNQRIKKRKKTYSEPFVTLDCYWQTLWNSIQTQTAKIPSLFVLLDINIPVFETEYIAKSGTPFTDDGNGADERQIVTFRMPIMVKGNYCGNIQLQFDMKKTDTREAIELAKRLTEEGVDSVATFVKQRHPQDVIQTNRRNELI